MSTIEDVVLTFTALRTAKQAYSVLGESVGKKCLADLFRSVCNLMEVVQVEVTQYAPHSSYPGEQTWFAVQQIRVILDQDRLSENLVEYMEQFQPEDVNYESENESSSIRKYVLDCYYAAQMVRELEDGARVTHRTREAAKKLTDQEKNFLRSLDKFNSTVLEFEDLMQQIYGSDIEVRFRKDDVAVEFVSVVHD